MYVTGQVWFYRWLWSHKVTKMGVNTSKGTGLPCVCTYISDEQIARQDQTNWPWNSFVLWYEGSSDELLRLCNAQIWQIVKAILFVNWADTSLHFLLLKSFTSLQLSSTKFCRVWSFQFIENPISLAAVAYIKRHCVVSLTKGWQFEEIFFWWGQGCMIKLK